MKKGNNILALFLSLLLILTFLLAGCKANTLSDEPAVAEDEPEEENVDTIEDIPDPPGELSPFTGLPVDEIYSCPYAVIVENLPPARPQSGLSKAEIVYEVPVEAYISRFLALYISPYEEDIGPVRSARPYLAYLAKEYDGIIAHCGYSIHTEAVLKKIGSKHIDERYNSTYYKRAKNRNMPHNLYTSLPRLAQGAEKLNYLVPQNNPPAPVFSFREKEIPEQIVSSISIAYSSENHVEYRWNPEGTYTRYNDGSPFIDANYGEAIEVKNIVVQFINARTFTEEGHLEIALTGEGKGLLFSGGAVEEIKWQKNSIDEKTRFFDTGSRDMLLQPGNTWIHLVPTSGKVEWSLDQKR